MQPDNQPAPNPTWMTWTGWIISVLPALMLFMSGGMKLANVKPPEGSPNIGWSESAMLGLAIVEIGSTLIYLCPRLAVFGAILLTAYLGGAVATHVRIGDMFIPQMLFGVLVWVGLIFRDQRLRALLPWRGDASVPATGGFAAALGKTCLTVLVLVGVLAALIAAQPAEFRVTRQATIDAPPAKVFEQVNDFHKWDAWSPWAKIDPNMKQTYDGASSGEGAIYSWSGDDKAGEGRMTLTESKPNELIRIRLDFERPMKATNASEFTFKADGNKTVVTWSLSGNKDFPTKAFFLVMNMDKLLGAEFDKGLSSMKSVAEAK